MVSGGKMSAAGALCLSQRSSELFPWATIQCARFKGTDEREYLDEAEFGGRLAGQIESSLGFIKRNIQKRMVLNGAKRKEEYEYPLIALRELVVNAVCHRDYSRSSAKTRIAIYDDRIEFINPGNLMAGISIESLGQGVSEIRNPVIAKILKDWGYIEEWGRGISKVIDACREHSLPPPIFREKGLFFEAVISAVSGELGGNELLALELIKKRGAVKAKELEKKLVVHRNTALNILKKLLDKRLITKIGRGKNLLYKIL
jgi:predicted HTH transcriptional regulator